MLKCCLISSVYILVGRLCVLCLYPIVVVLVTIAFVVVCSKFFQLNPLTPTVAIWVQL